MSLSYLDMLLYRTTEKSILTWIYSKKRKLKSMFDVSLLHTIKSATNKGHRHPCFDWKRVEQCLDRYVC